MLHRTTALLPILPLWWQCTGNPSWIPTQDSVHGNHTSKPAKVRKAFRFFTQKEAEPGFCTDGFSKGAPHGKLEPSSIELKACRILLGTGKSPRNQLRQNFPTAFGAPRLHGPLVDSVIGTRLPERLAQFWRGEECYTKHQRITFQLSFPFLNSDLRLQSTHKISSAKVPP